MVDRTCEAWILGFRCNKEPLPSVQAEHVVFLVREWTDGVLFHPLLPIYLSVGELTEGWYRVAEYTTKIKSSKTQFYKLGLAFKMLLKRTSGIRTHTTFRCDRFGGSWSSNEPCMAKLWPFYGYNIGGHTVNTTFRVTWSHRRAILHHSEWPTIFCVHKHNEDELLRNLSSKNNASAGEKVWVVAGWLMEHVKHEFLSFDATKSLLLLSRLNL
jgi:hypothetical protein